MVRRVEPRVAGRETLRLVRVVARPEGHGEPVRHLEEQVAAAPAQVRPATPARPQADPFRIGGDEL